MTAVSTSLTAFFRAKRDRELLELFDPLYGMSGKLVNNLLLAVTNHDMNFCRV